MERLFILLTGAKPEGWSWYDHHGDPVDPAEALARAARAPVVALHPGEAIAPWPMELPPLPRRERPRAALGLLEERLCGPLESYHCVVQGESAGDDGAMGADAPPVALVVSHGTMREWRAGFRQLGIRPTALISAPQLLPREPGEWSVLPWGERVLVRCGTHYGWTVERDNMATALALAWRESGTGMGMGAGTTSAVRLLRPPGEAIDPLPRELPWRETALEITPAALFIAHCPEKPGALNLLTGPYAPWRMASPGRRANPRWTLLLLGMLLLIVGGVELLRAHRLEATLGALEGAMADTYMESFPESRRVVRPLVQMEQKLAALRRSSGGAGVQGFLPLLNRAAEALSREDGVALEQLKYSGEGLLLTGAEADWSALEGLKRNLEAEGWRVNSRSSTRRDDRVLFQLELLP